MRIYKTWEVIKMLSENKNLKFMNKYGTIIGVDNEGCVTKYNGDGSRHTDLFRKNVDAEWELIQKPVDFMTAINSGKKIKSEYLDFYHYVEGTMELMRNLTRESTVRVFNGQWFVEEGDINE